MMGVLSGQTLLLHLVLLYKSEGRRLDVCDLACQSLYEELIKIGVDPLLDDRNERPGAKLAAMDLIGIPWQIVVGPRGMKIGLWLGSKDERPVKFQRCTDTGSIKISRRNIITWQY